MKLTRLKIDVQDNCDWCGEPIEYDELFCSHYCASHYNRQRYLEYKIKSKLLHDKTVDAILEDMKCGKK